MSGSETGLIASRDAFGLGLEKSSVPPSQPMIQNMGLGFMAPTSPSYNHQSAAAADGSTGVGTSVNMNMSMEPMSKKKRGRPRKYSPNGKMTGALTHAPPSAGGVFSPPPPLPPRPHVGAVVAAPCPSRAASPSSSSLKKARGRPRGSSKKHQMEVLEPVGLGFTPHVISVKAGEDVQAKIMSFSQHGPRAVCMLTANGTISNVTLRQPASSGGTVTYEGRFEILSLSGSFLLSENGSQRSRTGGLSVSLAGPDGCVIGGGVAGLLTAAAPVQVVVGSFISDGRKEFKPANQAEPLSVTPKLPMGTGATGESSPPSHGTPIGSSDGGSPLNHSMGAYNDRNPQGISAMPWK